MPFVKVNGVNLHYHVQGEGVPVILIHPPYLASNVFNYWKYQLSGFCQIITFDIRGHGHSEPSKVPVTYPIIVEDMKQLLDHLEIEQAVVGGYSTGGGVALEALLTYPHKFMGGIIVSGMSEISDIITKARVSAGVYAAAFHAKTTLSIVLSGGNADSKATFWNLYNEARIGYPKHWKEYSRYSLSYNCTQQLPGIKVPVLLIYGEKDKVFHKYARLLHQNIPDNELSIVKNLTHQIPTKAAAKTSDYIGNWITRRWPKVKYDEHLSGLDSAAIDDLGQIRDGVDAEQLLH
jgi:pimeloyl-ACP methyl ester carboxylesterase